MTAEFERELRESLYIHRPLPLHRERSLEARFPEKKILKRRTLKGTMTASGTGTLHIEGEQMTLSAPLWADHWPEGAPADGDYTNYGTSRVHLCFDAQDWRGYHRLRFSVLPQIEGARIAHLNVCVENRGVIPLPDRWWREGATAFDLEPGVWNECIWEFAAMPRDAVCTVILYVFCSGGDVGAGDTLRYTFRDLCLEAVEEPEHEHGWADPRARILLSSAGYFPEGRKTAIAAAPVASFRLLDAESGETVFEAAAREIDNERGRFRELDFSAYQTPGRYVLEADGLRSGAFAIDASLARESVWKMINFLFCERCGFPVPGRHQACHLDTLAEHKGEKLSFAGGWHDAGDVSQQALQTAETVLALFEAAGRCGRDTMLYLRLMEEAQWGLDFILRTRFGDGYRATSAGATRYTDNRIGSFDDVAVRVHDHAFENYLFAGVEAAAALALRGYDDALSAIALRAAREDYAFAEAVFRERGVEPYHCYEHSYNSGPSQYYAVSAWAASCLFEACGGEEYAARARQAGAKLLRCQEKGDRAPIAGFFYRDESKTRIVHFNHQSREHQFAQALCALWRTQPQAAERADWEAAMRLYGGYLKAIAPNTAPFGMLPAGVHRLDEAEDRELFPFLHVACDFDEEKENYKAQLAAGRDLGGGYVLRNFPVWFSFRGNNAVLLSAGKGASLLGRCLGDEELEQLGREQLYWLWGKNPFGQSLVYGVGEDYCRQYAVLCGECVGEVPVGIETRDNEDLPYWPQNNNATFREVWIGAVCRALLLCADYLE